LRFSLKGTRETVRDAAKRAETVREFQRKVGDTGSPEVQVALLTQRIGLITEHLKVHTRDHSSRRGLLLLVGQRRALLEYLKRRSEQAYRSLVDRLGLRG
jgi:small subunit ribosomal protein S15